MDVSEFDSVQLLQAQLNLCKSCSRNSHRAGTTSLLGGLVETSNLQEMFYRHALKVTFCSVYGVCVHESCQIVKAMSIS